MDINPQEDTNINQSLNQEQKLCYIYRHIRLDRNEVFYIGKGTMDGFCKIGVGTCCNGRIKTHKGFIWKFL